MSVSDHNLEFSRPENKTINLVSEIMTNAIRICPLGAMTNGNLSNNCYILHLADAFVYSDLQ